jgi:HD-GYP domain-containing protein (c-di-GMP phosphodiesterase class II)
LLKRIQDIQIPILTKITVPYIVLAMIIAAGGTFIISQVIIDSVEERFTNQLIETGLLASEGVVREEEDLLEALRLVSHTRGIGELVVARNRSSLNGLVLPTAYNGQVEAVVILDHRGIELLSLWLNEVTQVYEEFEPSQPFRQAAFVRKVLTGQVDLAGDKFGGTIDSERGQFLFISGPIQTADGLLVGVALVGRSVEGLADLIRRDTLAQVSFYGLDGAPLATTLLDGADLSQEVASSVIDFQETNSVSRQLQDGGVGYQELLASWEVRDGEDLGILGVALPNRYLVQTSQVTRSNTFVLMTVALVLVVVVGTLIATRITRPILELKNAALQVAEGNLDIKVNGQGRDEVAVLATSFNEMVDSLSRSKRDLLDAYDKTIEGWSRALDLRDHDTEGHSRRVADSSVRLATRLGLKDPELADLRRGALLHDIGKIAVPDSILLKTGDLTQAEEKIVRQHPIRGKEFMEQIEFLRPAIHVPYSHHERWDGSGYPQGLKGKDIPLAARIFAVVDVWDAITSDRPYRKAMGATEALEIILEGKGTQFDPEVVDAFLKLLSDTLKESKEAV